MATKHSVQVNETVATTSKQWLIVSNVAAGFTLFRSDLFFTVGAAVTNGIANGTQLYKDAGMWCLEIVDTGVSAFDPVGDFDDFRIMALVGYGAGQEAETWPQSTTSGLAGTIPVNESHWRGTRFYPDASDIYLAYSQSGQTIARVPKAWCSITYWTG